MGTFWMQFSLPSHPNTSNNQIVLLMSSMNTSMRTHNITLTDSQATGQIQSIDCYLVLTSSSTFLNFLSILSNVRNLLCCNKTLNFETHTNNINTLHTIYRTRSKIPIRRTPLPTNFPLSCPSAYRRIHTYQLKRSNQFYKTFTVASLLYPLLIKPNFN